MRRLSNTLSYDYLNDKKVRNEELDYRDNVFRMMKGLFKGENNAQCQFLIW